jgi:NitT/TauT family transport system substrate-binding protein
MRPRFQHLLTHAAVLGAALCATLAAPNPSVARELVMAEPGHSIGFLPVYVADQKGYFHDEGIDLKVTAMNTPAFVNAVLTGDAFAFLGSVDHNALAKVNGKELKAVVDLDCRANIYLLARRDLMPVTTDIASFLRGKRIAVSSFGGTPNNMLRYLLAKWGLEPGKDVTLIESSSAAVISTIVKNRQAEVGVSREPIITQAYSQGIWGQPIYNAARELGPYTDTAVSVRGDSLTREPTLVRGLVKAVLRGLIYVNAHQAEMLDAAKADFPTAAPQDLQASLTRSFTDGIFSEDGFIPPKAWDTGEAVIRQAGILKGLVAYGEVIDMHFVADVQRELNLH